MVLGLSRWKFYLHTRRHKGSEWDSYYDLCVNEAKEIDILSLNFHSFRDKNNAFKVAILWDIAPCS
jgi:hypothetical protein